MYNLLLLLLLLLSTVSLVVDYKQDEACLPRVPQDTLAASSSYFPSVRIFIYPLPSYPYITVPVFTVVPKALADRRSLAVVLGHMPRSQGEATRSISEQWKLASNFGKYASDIPVVDRSLMEVANISSGDGVISTVASTATTTLLRLEAVEGPALSILTDLDTQVKLMLASGVSDQIVR